MSFSSMFTMFSSGVFEPAASVTLYMLLPSKTVHPNGNTTSSSGLFSSNLMEPKSNFTSDMWALLPDG